MKVLRLVLATSLGLFAACTVRSGSQNAGTADVTATAGDKAEKPVAPAALKETSGTPRCLDPKMIEQITFLSDTEVPDDPEQGSYGSIAFRENDANKIKSIWGTSWLCPAGETRVVAQIPVDCSFTYFETRELRCDYIKTDDGLVLQDETL